MLKKVAITGICAAALALVSSSAFARDALVLNCKVTDANGRTLRPNEERAARENDHLVMSASADGLYSYRLELEGDVGTVEFLDKRNDTRFDARDVRFEVGQDLAFDLVNALPEDNLKLTCRARRQRIF